MIIFKKKKPIAFEKAYKKKSVKSKLIGLKERTHGFVTPFSLYQITSWVIFLANVLFQILVICYWLSEQTYVKNHILYLSIYSLLTDLTVLFFGLKTTITDPSDMTVRIERYHRMTFQKFDDNSYEFYCNKCDTNVKEFSKHCGKCQRCTDRFDHHCVWLNNCIGYNNYHWFICLMIATILHSFDIVAIASMFIHK